MQSTSLNHTGLTQHCFQMSISLFAVAVEIMLTSLCVFFLSALDRLNQMQEVGDSNVQTEATWFMKIGEVTGTAVIL